MIRYIFIFTLLSYNVYSQKDWSIAFYNVENLFDTIKAENKNDDDFLPQSQRNWNTFKYYSKLNKISQVIRSITEEYPPILFGLCEIENMEVLNDLVNRKAVKKHKYIPITFESPDKRGIQTALLYKEDFFYEIESKPINVSIEEDSFLTRDILYVKGILFNHDTIHLFVCHFPSRRGGKMESENRRIHASNILVENINNINQKNPNIVILGDFNDEPHDKSILNILYNSKYKLINTSKGLRGTHIFEGYWSVLDQIIISENLFKKSIDKTSFVYQNKFLVERNSIHKPPLPTYRGIFFKGGYSDHFPVFIRFRE